MGSIGKWSYPRIKALSAYGATSPLPGVAAKVRLLNRLPALDLGRVLGDRAITCYWWREAFCNPAVNSAWRVRPRSKITNVPAASSSSATDKTGMKNATDGLVEINRIIVNVPALSTHTSSAAVAMLESIRNRLRCLEY